MRNLGATIDRIATENDLWRPMPRTWMRNMRIPFGPQKGEKAQSPRTIHIKPPGSSSLNRHDLRVAGQEGRNRLRAAMLAERKVLLRKAAKRALRYAGVGGR